VDRLVGDEVVALYIPGFAGQRHAQRAFEAARLLLRATGHADEDGPWMPIGVGVHTGLAYVGMVGSEGGVSDLTAMGDSMNVAARITELASTGEALVSQPAFAAAGLNGGDYEQRRLALKGRKGSIDVLVLKVGPF
jgi:class 3 adenylate cyclase